MNLLVLKQSLEAIEPVTERVINHLYGRLVESLPAAKSSSEASMKAEQKKFLHEAFSIVFDHLDNQEVLGRQLRSAANRYSKYSPQSFQYAWVAENLVETLRYFFGQTWTNELEDSWIELLDFVGTVLIESRKETKMIENQNEKGQENIRAEIALVLRGVIRDSLVEAMGDKEIRELAASAARTLIKESLSEQLDLLRDKKPASQAA